MCDREISALIKRLRLPSRGWQLSWPSGWRVLPGTPERKEENVIISPASSRLTVSSARMMLGLRPFESHRWREDQKEGAPGTD